MAPDGKFCLFKRKNKDWMNGRVHPSYKVIGRKGKQLENYIIHNMANNISALLRKFNRNTSFHAVDRIEQNYNLKKFFSNIINETPTVYGKTIDKFYNETHIGGALHRLFDQSHSPIDMWEKVKVAVKDDTKLDELKNYFI